ncbi:MAG TPA: hypothetical protein PLN34_02575 [Alloprevotella sp.]|mgnify:CR=1 FL=1|nr:hypothetical protein [Alloprevotella sp.]
MKLYFPILSLFIISCALNACQENFDTRLKREARDYTLKHCPQNIEENNVLDSTTYDIATRTYHRWFTLSGLLDTPESAAAMQNYPEDLKRRLTIELKNAPDWKECKEQGINFAYTYRSARTGKTLFNVRLSKNDYQ